MLRVNQQATSIYYYNIHSSLAMKIDKTKITKNSYVHDNNNVNVFHRLCFGIY